MMMVGLWEMFVVGLVGKLFGKRKCQSVGGLGLCTIHNPSSFTGIACLS